MIELFHEIVFPRMFFIDKFVEAMMAAKLFFWNENQLEVDKLYATAFDYKLLGKRKNPWNQIYCMNYIKWQFLLRKINEQLFS